MNTKDNPKNKLEWFAFLNALLVQFSALNGYYFEIKHHKEEDWDSIDIELEIFSDYIDDLPERVSISIDLDLSDQEITAKFNEARSKIVTFSKLTDKAKGL